MTASEKKFKMPIKVYHGASVTKAERDIMNFLKNDDNAVSEEDLKKEPDWVMGYIYIPFEDILGWGDSFSTTDEVADVAEKGFSLTLVYTKTMGEMLCVWTVKQFMAKYDAHAAKLAQEISV